MTLYEEVMQRGYSTEPGIASEETDSWRTRMFSVLESTTAPPWVKDKSCWPLTDARGRLKKFEDDLEQIDKTLRDIYGTPHHYNLADPIAEILLIILARKTPEKAYLRAHERLLRKYNSWRDMLEANDADILEMVYDGGLGDKKVIAVKNMLQLIFETFGEFSMEATSSWEDSFLQEFLSQVPEVGPKSALCIMSYTFGRASFGVDAHIGRVLARLNITQILELNLTIFDHKQKQKILTDLVPPYLRYSLHVNMLAHGRSKCSPSKPKCHSCPIADYCASKTPLGSNT